MKKKSQSKNKNMLRTREPKIKLKIGTLRLSSNIHVLKKWKVCISTRGIWNAMFPIFQLVFMDQSTNKWTTPFIVPLVFLETVGMAWIKTMWNLVVSKGNDCRHLVTHLEYLDENLPSHLYGYLTALKAFASLEDSCFGYELDPFYRDRINDFVSAYKALGLPITTKVWLLRVII